jgi:tetratricopeptide (TPR) repeat protein
VVGGALVLVALVVAGVVFLPDLIDTGDATGTPESQAAATASPDSGEQQPVATMSVEAREHLEAGQAALEAGDLNLALAEFNLVIEDGAESAEVYYWRGVAYYTNGELELAQVDLERSVSLDPQLVEANYQLGELLAREMSNCEEAVEYLSHAIRLDSQLVDGYIERALCYLETEQYGLAEGDIESVIGLAPERAEGWLMRGEYSFWDGLYTQAIPDLVRGLEIKPDDSWGWQMLGISQYLTGEYAQALESHEQAIELEPSEIEHQYDRAVTLLTMGEADAAAAVLEQVLSENPWHNGANYVMGLLAMEEDSYEQAVTYFEAVLGGEEGGYQWPYYDQASAEVDLAVAHHALGRTDQALEQLAVLLDEDPSWWLPLYRRGLIYRDLGRMDEAEADLRAALEDVPANWQQEVQDALSALNE